ncbi:MAG: putative MarR-family transcriptional regulator [Marmoricola sp.]|nr:putative MarR-family transcriptional regulator [Marmoricola sp.]
MSTTSRAAAEVGSGRTDRAEAVSRLFDALIGFSRSLKARGGDWATLDPELSRGDVVLLGVVAAGGPLRPGHIAAKLAVDASVVSRQLAGLHRSGLVERGPDPADRRAELISLSPAGHERLVRAREVMCGALAERLDHWDVTAVLDAAAMVDDLGHRLHEPLLHPATPSEEIHA